MGRTERDTRPAIREMHTTSEMRNSCTLIGATKVRNSDKAKCCKDVEEADESAAGDGEWYRHSTKDHGGFLKTELYNAAIDLLGMYPR